MTTPIHQWLEGKEKKSGFEHIGYDRAVADFKAALPSLLSAMEAEIRERIGNVDTNSLCKKSHENMAQCIMQNCELENLKDRIARIHTIIHEVFNPQE